jgi:hypothetical protein
MSLEKDKKQRSISIINTIFLYISTVSIFNVILLSIEYFYPLISVFGSLILLFLIFVVFKIRVVKERGIFSLLFLAIILLAIFFRISPNLYLTGGQDQGSYVSLSKQYEINHSLYIKDELRESLSEEGKEIYDKSGAATMLGVSPLDLEDSTYYMPFYPVSPSWMSIFGTLFGSDNRVYAISMFAILSILATYLFSYEISGRRKSVGLTASFLLAINPLHVYFSKIPLTEIVSLTFFFFSLYFLIKFYNDFKEGEIRKFTLFLSLLSATVLFYTRMSALIFSPIIVLIPILSLLFVKDRKLTKYLTIYSIFWFLSLGISYLFYYFFLPDLFTNIFEGRVLNLVSLEILLITLGGIFFLLPVVFLSSEVKRYLKRGLQFLRKHFLYIFLIFFFSLILYELWLYISEIFIKENWSIFSHQSLSYFKQLNFLATLLYLSPLGFLLLPFAVYHLIKKRDGKYFLLISSLLLFFVYCWGVMKLSPYHYYFVRYQLSELIPLCIVVLSIFLVDLYESTKYKKIMIFISLFPISYFLFFSSIQLRDYEGADKSKFEYLSSIVGKDDILLVAGNEFSSAQQIVFPMKYYYEINTFSIYRFTYMKFPEVEELKKKYKKVYILTATTDWKFAGTKSVKEIEFKNNYFVHCLRDEDAYFEMDSHSPDIPLCEYMIIPNRYYYGTYKMYLYSWE